MVDINEEFQNLIKQVNKDEVNEFYKLKAIYFERPFILIGIDITTLERRIYIDITSENWTDDELKSFPKWRGLSITKEYFEKIGPLLDKRFLIIYQEAERSEEIFEKVLQSLVDRILVDDEKSLYSTIYEVLDRWNSFFRNKPSGKLTLEEQMGLFGELNYIKNWLEKFPNSEPTIIENWMGPSKNRIDFIKNKIGVEIKTISPKLRDDIRISNEMQLELSDVINKIYLYVLKIEIAQFDGKTIQEMIDDIRIILLDRSQTNYVRFNEELVKLYVADGEYSDAYFYIHDESAYLVTEDFPKVTTHNLPIGISNVSYVIDLSHCLDFRVDTEEVYDIHREGS